MFFLILSLNLITSLTLKMYKSFTEMPVWQKAHKLSIEIFHLTVDLPRSEDYGLTS